MQAKIASNRTTRRFLKHNATNWLIIEADRSLHDDAVARLKSAFDGCRGAFLVSDLYVSALEGPAVHLDEHARPVIGHQQRRVRYHHPHDRWRNEGNVGEHVGLE